MILTEQEIKLIGEGNTGTWQDDLQFARAIESAVLEKLKAQEPVVFWLCNGCGHYYQECEDCKQPVSSCDCMTDSTMFRKELYQLPPADVVRDPRLAELKAVLRECREAFVKNIAGSSGRTQAMHEAILKIDEVLNEDR